MDAGLTARPLQVQIDDIRNGDQKAFRTVTIQLQNEDHTAVVATWKLLRARIIKHVSGMVVKDDGYLPGRAVANLTEMKDSTFAVVGLTGTAVLNATKDTVAEAGIQEGTSDPRIASHHVGHCGHVGAGSLTEAG